MRDLKFRVWDKKDKRYIEWWELIFPLYKWEEERRININEQHYRNTDSHWDNNDIRFDIDKDTWLRDKNGVKIYEGDIIQSQIDDVVEVWQFNKPNFTYSASSPKGMAFDNVCIEHEVIWNIHETPLLSNK